MSALRKQSTLRWSHRNEITPGGAILCTVWTARVGRFDLTIVNWPGTSTMDWEIVLNGTDFRNGGSESRCEHTVSTLKDKVFAKALELQAKHP